MFKLVQWTSLYDCTVADLFSVLAVLAVLAVWASVHQW